MRFLERDGPSFGTTSGERWEVLMKAILRATEDWSSHDLVLACALRVLAGADHQLSVSVLGDDEPSQNVAEALAAAFERAGVGVQRPPELLYLPDAEVVGQSADLVAVVGAGLAQDAAVVAALNDLRRDRGPAPAVFPASRPPAVYLGGDRVLVSPTFGGKILCAASDRSITPDLVLDGVYDPGLCRFLQRRVRAGGVCVDVGANIGVMTLLMAQCVGRSGSVYAYEANPGVARLLNENVSVNYLHEVVTVRPVAVGAGPGDARLHVSRHFQGNSSLNPHDRAYRDFFASDDFEVVDVPVVALDDDLPDGLEVDVVKIDVEGAEAAVFTGMSALMDAGRIRSVVFELLARRTPGPQWDVLCDELRKRSSQGWSTGWIDADGNASPLPVEQLLARGEFSSALLTAP